MVLLDKNPLSLIFEHKMDIAIPVARFVYLDYLVWLGPFRKDIVTWHGDPITQRDNDIVLLSGDLFYYRSIG